MHFLQILQKDMDLKKDSSIYLHIQDKLVKAGKIY